MTNEWNTFIRKLKESAEQNGFAVEQILGQLTKNFDNVKEVKDLSGVMTSETGKVNPSQKDE